MNTKIIAIAQHKGGVGKTTTSINIAAALAKKKYKVLLVDMDAQANLTESLGIKADRSIADALSGTGGLPIVRANGIDVVPSSLELAGIEAQLYGKMLGREQVLKALLGDVKDRYDFILLDCPPSLGLLTINALTSAEDIIIPVQAQFLAVRGLNSLLDIIKLVKTQLNKQLNILGVVITQYDKRKVLNRDTSEALEEMFKKELFKTRIRDNVALAEAPTAQQDIFSYNDESNGAADYLALTEEILKRYKMTATKTLKLSDSKKQQKHGKGKKTI